MPVPARASLPKMPPSAAFLSRKSVIVSLDLLPLVDDAVGRDAEDLDDALGEVGPGFEHAGHGVVPRPLKIAADELAADRAQEVAHRTADGIGERDHALQQPRSAGPRRRSCRPVRSDRRESRRGSTLHPLERGRGDRLHDVDELHHGRRERFADGDRAEAARSSRGSPACRPASRRWPRPGRSSQSPSRGPRLAGLPCPRSWATAWCRSCRRTAWPALPAWSGRTPCRWPWRWRRTAARATWPEVAKRRDRGPSSASSISLLNGPALPSSRCILRMPFSRSSIELPDWSAACRSSDSVSTEKPVRCRILSSSSPVCMKARSATPPMAAAAPMPAAPAMAKPLAKLARCDSAPRRPLRKALLRSVSSTYAPPALMSLRPAIAHIAPAAACRIAGL